MYRFTKIYFIVLLLLANTILYAQNDTLIRQESTIVKKIKPIHRIVTKKDSSYKKDSSFIKSNWHKKDSTVIKDTTLKLAMDSIFLKDSLLMSQKKKDSIKTDSIRKSVIKASLMPKDTTTYSSVFGGAYIPINLPSIPLLEQERKPQGKEVAFFILVGIVALLGFTKAIFPKYFANMFSLFFQTSYRKHQSIDQLTNNKLSSLLLNTCFVLTLGLYIDLLFEIKGIMISNFLIVFLYSSLAFIIIYLFKYLFLSFLGWAFNAKEELDSYIFIVFHSNKIVSIVLLPLLFLLAFNGNEIGVVVQMISYFIIGFVFIYRLIVVVSSLSSKLKVNAFHFFLYFCALEILPLLLIEKALFRIIPGSI